MTAYLPPLRELRFLVTEVGEAPALPGSDDLDSPSVEVINAILEQAGRLAADVLAPLNRTADRHGARLEGGAVRTPEGFRAAYRAFVDGGWNAVPFPRSIGGQGLPWTLTLALFEMWEAACLSFSLCPTLSQAAIECLSQYAPPDVRSRYLPKLISGEWSGTMNLTEPQAGSDLGAIRMRADREGDHYRLAGSKIFITYGDHDLAENILHVVLARVSGAPPGVRGLSCFLVPKRLVAADRSLGAINDVRPVAIEHKLGIHGSPTLVMAYGDEGGAVGYRLGEENAGVAVMFTMMNNARLLVGLEGVALAERAYQQALRYARGRVQGRGATADAVAVVEHPDVRRMLMTMRAETEAARALAHLAAGALDRSRRAADPAMRATAARRVELLTPIVKAFCSDTGVAVTSLALQVHGGMGYIEETGIAQHYRDARIVPIYEGTNGIQARDLVGRKLGQDGGAAARALVQEVRGMREELISRRAGQLGGLDRELGIVGAALASATSALETATSWLIEALNDEPRAALAGATPYLRLCGTVIGGYGLAKGAQVAARRITEGSNDPFYRAKIATARFFAEQILPPAAALLGPITRGVEGLYGIAPEHLEP
ncbi:MAG: acyl-CoA dehydrogenase [Alphaproteobacteria bacterium]|nr:acyl-CoA dehydrogenase [Alphaproteobacteria bacterium]